MKKVRNETIELTKEDFSFVCPLKTEDMSSVEGGYFCAKCEKKVHDVTNYTEEDFETLRQKSADVCVTFKKVATVSLVLGLTACSPKPSFDSPRIIGKVANPDCQSSVPKRVNHNRLTPFSTIDKNQTITSNSWWNKTCSRSIRRGS